MANKKINKTDNKKTNKEQNPNSSAKGIILLLLMAFALAYYYTRGVENVLYTDNKIGLNKLEQNFKDNKYYKILIDKNKALATYKASFSGALKDKLGRLVVVDSGIKKVARDVVILPRHDSLKDLGLKEPNIDTIIEVKDNTSEEFWAEMLPTILTIVLFGIVAFFILGRMGGIANNAMLFGRSRARLYDKDKNKIRFKDVAGAEEEKQELQEIVDFLKNPKKYKEIGAKIPKGTLLVGPPGTGKTLLARAVAGESNVPFLSISGSEFVEMFVGVGASRVRDLFAQAKKMAPAIIFIDEIDAIGKKRGPGTGGGHDEREQTLNQILTEMDGFDNDTNVIVLGATNRVDVLDKALTRPGRFDRKITVNLPNLVDREKILEVHARNKKISRDIDFKEIASKTVGFSGADLDNLLNEAAIITARENNKIITQKYIDNAFERIVMGLRKKSQVMSEKEKEITAYHEVGHALVGKILPNTDPVHKVSIVSRGGALGVTWFLPERDKLLVSKAKYLDELATLYGGRVAEEIFFGKENITTGASNDIERATDIARKMVMKYGMFEEVGEQNFEGEVDSYSQTGIKPFLSDETIKQIDEKVKEVLKNAYNTAKKIIEENKKLHEEIAKDLLEKEEIDKEEFEEYFKSA